MFATLLTRTAALTAAVVSAALLTAFVVLPAVPADARGPVVIASHA